MRARRPEVEPPGLPETIRLERLDESRVDIGIRIVTPMFGGGHTARKTDDEMLVSAKAIRGHLRFWWRTLYGPEHGSVESLRAAEESIWGSASKPSVVSIETVCSNGGTKVPCPSRMDRSTNLPHYALFPYQPNPEQGTPSAVGRLGVVFRLCVTGPRGVIDGPVRAALDSWLLFGGYGGRTRRGCGTLHRVDGHATPWPIAPQRLAGVASTGMTALFGSHYVLGPSYDDPVRAWADAVRQYERFRQGRDFAREHGVGSIPGRSLWPEAMAIRRITGKSSPKQRPEPGANLFPRANLGLPINFHFKDRGEPADTSLEPAADELRRFASPVITKAVCHAGQWRPLLLILASPSVSANGDLTLRGRDIRGDIRIARQQVELSSRQAASVPPLARFGNLPVREALLSAVADAWRQTPRTIGDDHG